MTMTMSTRRSHGNVTSSTQDDDEDSDADDDSHSNKTSKESAALARGAARTAAASASASAGRTTAVATRGVMAGRLPISSSAATKTATTVSSKSIGSSAATSTTRVLGRKAPHLKVPRGGSSVKVSRGPPSPRSSSTPLSSRTPKARADSIARVSDRASKGLDVINAGLGASSSETHSQHNNRITKSITHIMQQAVSFGKVFITNTMLGMAVFATYEGMIEHLATPLNEESTHETTNSAVLQPIYQQVTEESSVDVMDQATLSQHFLAGAMGGAAHAALSLVFELKLSKRPDDVLSSSCKRTTSYRHPILQTVSSKPIHLQVPTFHYSMSSMIHHSMAHSVLFGSYQLTKRLLMQQMHTYNSKNNSINNSGLGNDTIRVATIAVAGGVAGQFQHVISHFSEQLVLGTVVDDVKHNSTTSTSSTSLLRRVLTISSWPTWRSTVMTFPPSAIGFLAFEYGKLLNISDDNDANG